MTHDKFNLSLWAVKHPAFVLFLIIASLIGGLLSYKQLGRSEDPQFMIPAMSIIMVWPGATAEEIQNQVMNPIESKLQELDNVQDIRTFSRQGYGGINLQIRGGQSPEALKQLWYQARKKIGDLKVQLPNGVHDPIFNDEFSDIYSVMYALTSADLSMSELLDQAENIKKQLQHIPNARKVHIFGEQKEQIYVEFSSQKLAGLNISPLAIMQAMQKANTITPAGTIETANDRVFVRLANTYKNTEDVKQTRIFANGKSVRLGDIAQVYHGYQEPQEYLTRYNGQPAIMVAMSMQAEANVLQFNKDVNQHVATIKTNLPLGMEMTKVTDQPRVVKESVHEFVRSFIEALIIVLVVCFVSLGFRPGLVVATSIPVVLAIVCMVMLATKWSLDRVTLGALIIALGLLVDDAIIAVEMMMVKMEEGIDRIQAASFAYTTTAFPMLTGTLITIAGFMPVGFAKSNAGQYAGGIFWIVAYALVISWFVAVIFTPYLGVKLLKVHHNEQSNAAATHSIYDSKFYQWFKRVLIYTVANKIKVILATLILFIAALAGMKLVQQQFFPTASRPELHVTLRLRQGASIAATEAAAKQLESLLRKDPDVQFFSTYIGKSSPRYFLSSMPELPNNGYAQFVVMTKGLESRERLRSRLIHIFNDGRFYADAITRVERLEFGPPVNYPVSFKVIGPDTNMVRDIAYKVEHIMRASPYVKDVLLEWNEQARSVDIDVNEDEAAKLGITKQDIANTIQSVVSGIPVTFIPKGEHQINVTLRAEPSERNAIESLQNIKLFGPTGQSIMLSQVAQVKINFENPVLWRNNREAFLGVSADVQDGTQAPYASAKINQQLDSIRASLPSDYRIDMAGAIEESNRANLAIAKVFPVMLLVILLCLMMQLQSFSKTLMVFLTAPLGLIGVVPALLISNSPFGFVALVGVIALAGMVMRNSVILVDQISQDIDKGIDPYAAIIDATIRRARPVILTALAAILAMIPLSRSIFWGPMAIAIMGGLLIGTLLTLVFVPALYATWFKVKAPS